MRGMTSVALPPYKFLGMGLVLAMLCTHAHAVQDPSVSLMALRKQLAAVQAAAAQNASRLADPALAPAQRQAVSAEKERLSRQAAALRQSIAMSEQVAEMPGVMYVQE